MGNVYPPLLLDDHDRDTHSKSPEALKSQTLARKWALWERNLFWCNNPLKVTPAVSAATFTGGVKWLAYRATLKSNPLGRTNCTYKLMDLILKKRPLTGSLCLTHMYDADRSRHTIASWCNARAILCRKLWSIADVSWCSVLTVIHLSGSQAAYLLIPALNLHTGSTFRQFGLPTASILEKQKQEPHGWGSSAAWGMLAATFKRAPVGFMKLETQKRRLPLNVPALRGSPH